MNKLLIPIVKEQAESFGIDTVAVCAFIEVETGGLGFNTSTGKIIIQFEPSWFKKQAPYAPSGLWSVNKVDVQSQEWLAFNDAFSDDPEAAMKSTSIGLGQIMGFHYETLGYNSVDEMWDDAKLGIDRQIWQICKFIFSNTSLLFAIKDKDWDKVARIYNGSKYKELAIKYNRTPYDISMKQQYDIYSKLV